MKRCIFLPVFILVSNILFALPKMIKVNDITNGLNIEISETLVTMKDYEEYITANGKKSISDFENKKIRQRDIYYKIDFDKEWPLWGITWRDAAEYCNWLSKNAGLKPCYVYAPLTEKKKYNDITIDRSADGYRMPYVRELIILSGMKDGLSKEQFEEENLCNMEKDVNRLIPSPVYEGRKNKYGIYDILGNLVQYCNDYYLEDFNYFDYSLSPYGPDTYTPDTDQVWYKLPLTAVRCYFGGYWVGTYDGIMKRNIYDANEISTETVGIRLVRNLK